MTPHDRIRTRIAEAQAIAALLGEAAATEAHNLVAARAAGLRDALAELATAEAQPIPPSDRRPAPRFSVPVPSDAAQERSALPQVFGDQWVAQQADAAVSALPPDPPRPVQEEAPQRRHGPPPGRPTSHYSVERLALLHEMWPTSTTTEDVLAALNALPGPPIASIASLISKAKTLKSLPARPHWTLRLTAEERAGLAQKMGSTARRLAAEAGARRRTPERDALIRQHWHDLSLTVPQLAERCGALPGDPVGPTWVWRRAVELGLPSSRHAAAEAAAQHAPPAPATAAAAATAATPTAPPNPLPAAPRREPSEAEWRADPLGTLSDDERADAEEVVLAKGYGARFLSDDFGWPLERAQAVAAALRETRRTAA